MNIENLKEIYNNAKIEHFDDMEIVRADKKHIEYLIAEVEKLESKNKNLNMKIGRYAGQILEIVGKQQNLNREASELTIKMFRGETD